MKGVNKVISIFVFVCALCVIFSGVFSLRLGRDISVLLEYKKLDPKIKSVEGSIARLPNVESDLSLLRKEAESLKYNSAQLTSTVSQELSSFGMIVMDVSLKASDKNSVLLFIKGVVPAEKVNSFVLGVSGMEKLFFIRKLAISPRVSAVQLIERLEQVKQNPKQLESLLGDIEKGSLDSFMVEIEAMAVTG